MDTPEQKYDKKPANLLWTGGWDSTFRLLQLLLIEKREVQTYYLVRNEESTGAEIDAMIKIRRFLSRNYPFTRNLLQPFHIEDSENIPEYPETKRRYQELIKEKKVNQQYKDLAEFCCYLNISDMEIGIEGPVKENAPDYFDQDCEIFGNFISKIGHLTKKDMQVIAQKNGWMEIMESTVFCRRPKGGKPCGFCGPCTDAVYKDRGMSWRLPIRARILAYLQLPFRKWWRSEYQQQKKGILKYIPKMLKGKF